jgi:hypothetical protein
MTRAVGIQIMMSDARTVDIGRLGDTSIVEAIGLIELARDVLMSQVRDTRTTTDLSEGEG